jgi:hypothetical protein
MSNDKQANKKLRRKIALWGIVLGVGCIIYATIDILIPPPIASDSDTSKITRITKPSLIDTFSIKKDSLNGEKGKEQPVKQQLKNFYQQTDSLESHLKSGLKAFILNDGQQGNTGILKFFGGKNNSNFKVFYNGTEKNWEALGGFPKKNINITLDSVAYSKVEPTSDYQVQILDKKGKTISKIQNKDKLKPGIYIYHATNHIDSK